MRVVHRKHPEWDYDKCASPLSRGDMYVGCGLLVWTTEAHRDQHARNDRPGEDQRLWPVIRRSDVTDALRCVTCLMCLVLP